MTSAFGGATQTSGDNKKKSRRDTHVSREIGTLPV